MPRESDSATRWVWRGGLLGALLIGWVFIAWHNNFHFTAATAFVCLGYLAVVATVYTLFKTGSSMVADDDDDAAAWGLTLGARHELLREKQSLLKAIKEAEFDHQMGKLSKQDLDAMVRNYRARAIEVIKLLEGAEDGSVRNQIELEIRARLEVESVHAKVERAHAQAARKHSALAAAAAQKAAREAAQAGASAMVAREAAKQASQRAIEEAEAAEAAAAPTPTSDDSKTEGAAP